VVLLGDRVQEGQLVVGEEGVRHPDLFGEVARQRHVVVVAVRERQTLVGPVLVQVDRDRVVLHGHRLGQSIGWVGSGRVGLGQVSTACRFSLRIIMVQFITYVE